MRSKYHSRPRRRKLSSMVSIRRKKWYFGEGKSKTYPISRKVSMVCQCVQCRAVTTHVGRAWGLELVIRIITRNRLQVNDLRGWNIQVLQWTCETLENTIHCKLSAAVLYKEENLADNVHKPPPRGRSRRPSEDRGPIKPPELAESDFL